MIDPLTLVNTRVTPQSEMADPRQVKNNAGGHTFRLDQMALVRRFLTLGTANGTYYVGEHELTKQSAGVVLELARTNGMALLDEILAISLGGRAPKQNPTLFALAAVAGLGGEEARRAAATVLPQVARTGTHLFLFAKYVEQFRGWGPTLKRGVASWYLKKPVDKLAYQLIKYRNREGWTHKDMLRLSHPQIDNPEREPATRAAFDFVCGRDPGPNAPRLIEGFLKAQASPNPLETANLVAQYGLPWEALIPEHLNDRRVWAELLNRGMPQTALMRNLPKLTNLGLLVGSVRNEVATQLADGMSKSDVHPINVLIAQRTYASGASVRGSSTWTPVPAITDALDAGFYEAFGGVEPAGKRTLVALDVSGSMGFCYVGNLPITPREASAALAMVLVGTEPETTVVGFTAGASRGRSSWDLTNTALTPLDLSRRRRLDDVIMSISNLPFGGTDCALPWTWATEQGLEFDTVITLTDNETWAGTIHPHQAMRRYRDQTGIPARSVIVGMTATDLSVNDPADPLGLDVAGFDSAVPNLINDFSAGRI